MNGSTLLACILIAAALTFVTYMTFWSRRTIDRIARKGTQSAREILRDLHGDRET